MNDFAAALRDLNDAGIRYVIVGGLAVIRHGAVRATKDVDVAVAMDGDNLMRLEHLVERWQATNPDGTPLRSAKLAAGGVLALRTPTASSTSCPTNCCRHRSTTSRPAPMSSGSTASRRRSARSPTLSR
ncbi:MAG: hypothetical protein Q8K79_07280 [Solirubrobacteraceae bacterium]|nr:hypothetical protein [Solirubrobacteraceae bacterium]